MPSSRRPRKYVVAFRSAKGRSEQDTVRSTQTESQQDDQQETAIDRNTVVAAPNQSVMIRSVLSRSERRPCRHEQAMTGPNRRPVCSACDARVQTPSSRRPRKYVVAFRSAKRRSEQDTVRSTQTESQQDDQQETATDRNTVVASSNQSVMIRSVLSRSERRPCRHEYAITCPNRRPV